MMNDTFEIILGDEDDQELRSALLSVLLENNATQLNHSRAVGGSQEIETSSFKIENKTIIVEAETYNGLTLTGDKTLVEELAKQVALHRSGKRKA